MHKFTDTLGRDWNICVNVGTVRRAKDETGIDILALMDFPKKDGEQTPLQVLTADPMKVVGVVAAICEGQLKERGIDAVAFAEAFTGETLEKATDALLEGVVDFFPQPRRNYMRSIKEAAAKAAEAENKAMEDAVKNRVFEKVVDEALGKLSTATPES